MTDNEIDWEAIKKYQKIFGIEKMKALWLEFVETTTKDLEEIENKNPEEVRLHFHSWRSSALIFGMKHFSKECEWIECEVKENRNCENIQKQIDNCRIFFHNNRKEVDEFFEGVSYGENSDRK